MPRRLILRAALVLYAFGILSIGLTRDWRLRHEDNGAMHTTLALSHLRLGIAATRAHDMFFNPHSGEASPYGHHPPATALLVAGAAERMRGAGVSEVLVSDSIAGESDGELPVTRVGIASLLADVVRRLMAAGSLRDLS